ncbi:acetyl-CoA C-acyltransferase [Aurantibacillus circumpalustris]|uniref:acetyl-CoA C-acyltransferase n=1 Tax=Aurantibacillus circumpalustris TaxID=3036359 RepID=UPI00295A57D0|nr:acetyl-CoA C-acyltransferase [Aurantibacillus circumpalustris]
MKEVYIISAKRTAVGGLLGSLSHLSATQLGAIAIKDAYESAGIDPKNIDSVYMGNVLSANLGQSPARQAAIFAGIPNKTDATTINKVCSSGMKATAIGTQQIQLGLENIVVTGGMESMSNTPHYVNVRRGTKAGDLNLVDGMIKDGLWDVYNNFHMGSAAELGVTEYKLSREALDNYAIQSYQKAQQATKEGKFKNEIIPILVKQKNGTLIIDKDEDIDKIILEKVSKLKPVFEKNGNLTAANSSNLNDGSAALILASKEAVEKYNLKPIAKIIAYADAAQAPEKFPTSPAIAIPKALEQANLKLNDIDLFEINEAYASVVLSNQQILGLDLNKVNIYGGAVAIGHPIGASGARIIATLISALKQENKKLGTAAICNGGGGASAMIIESI